MIKLKEILLYDKFLNNIEYLINNNESDLRQREFYNNILKILKDKLYINKINNIIYTLLITKLQKDGIIRDYKLIKNHKSKYNFSCNVSLYKIYINKLFLPPHMYWIDLSIDINNDNLLFMRINFDTLIDTPFLFYDYIQPTSEYKIKNNIIDFVEASMSSVRRKILNANRPKRAYTKKQ